MRVLRDTITAKAPAASATRRIHNHGKADPELGSDGSDDSELWIVVVGRVPDLELRAPAAWGAQSPGGR